MASERPNPSAVRGRTPTVSPTWLRGLAAGLIGGLGAGVFLALTVPTALAETLPGLVGTSGVGAGWLVLLVGSGVLGIAFTEAVERRPVRRPLSTAVVLGIGYAVALWFVAALAVPTWLGVVGANELPIPWLDPTVLAGLLLYGVVLGIGHWLFG
jgi:hypothetical protein